MGRHKYDIHRRAFGSDAYGSGEAHRTEDPAPAALAADALLGPEAAEGLAGGAQRPITGEGVFDVAKDLAKRVGMKAVNKLAKKSGRKIGKEIVGRTLCGPSPDASLGPSAQTIPMKENESAGDRIREILEANSLTRFAGPRPSRTRRAEGSRKDRGPAPKASASLDQRPKVRRSESTAADQRHLTNTQKVNEAVSRLLAEDD